MESSYPPLAAGVWTWRHEFSTNITILACKGITTAVSVSSVVLELQSKSNAGLQRQAEGRGLNGKSPSGKDRSISRQGQNNPGQGNWQARLAVEMSDEVLLTREEAERAVRATPKAAVRNACELGIASPAWRGSELILQFRPPTSRGSVLDVVFYFPRSKRELWANSNTYKKASPHCKALFNSQFKESSSPPKPPL